jgi:DNA-directed RNA polymerase subunit RPC12/RpoP
MADILGQQQKQPKIDLSQATEMECTECGGTVFIQGTKFLKISRIITGQPKDGIIPAEVYLCGDCGEINQELLPDEFKKVKTK